MFSLSICTLLLQPQISFAQEDPLPSEVKNALSQVRPDEIKSAISYLADDQLKGRGPGTPGYQLAIDYVTARLKSLKVTPAGENGTWLQTVRLRKAFVKDQKFDFQKSGQQTPEPAATGSFSIYPNPLFKNVRINSALVFAGYGISQPALGYDDYKGIDVKGKTVVVLRGAPDKFPSSVAAHVMNSTTIFKEAVKHGAIGVIMVTADSTLKTLRDLGNGVYSVLDSHGKVAVSRSFYHQQIKLYAALQYTLLERWIRETGKDLSSLIIQLKAAQPQSFVLPVNIKASAVSTYQDLLSYNVVGKITGSDPNLKNEYVVHSAHLDHLGIGKPVEGDSIYNGAHDNASGIASLLGIAKIYDHLPEKPKRSILLVMVTGEELGLLGSGYFANNPVVPVKNIIADVNTDMPTIIAPLLSITALGAEHSSLSKQVDQAARYLDLSVEPDPEPKQARFTRSDQYSFVIAGIPSLHIKYGSRTTDGKNNLNEKVAVWRAKYYHKPQDDINGIFDFEAGVKYVQLNFLIGYLVAQDVNRPVWNAGDIFAK